MPALAFGANNKSLKLLTLGERDKHYPKFGVIANEVAGLSEDRRCLVVILSGWIEHSKFTGELAVEKLHQSYLGTSRSVACIKNLTGEFCGVIIDYKNWNAYIVQDPLGICRAYVGFAKGIVVVSNHLSEVYRPISTLEKLELNRDYVRYFLADRQPGILTPFVNIQKVGYGMALCVDWNSMSLKQFPIWPPPPTDKLSGIDEEEILNELRFRMTQAVHRRLTNDKKKILIEASGGYDSSIVAFISQQINHDERLKHLLFGHYVYENKPSLSSISPRRKEIEKRLGSSKLHYYSMRRGWVLDGVPESLDDVLLSEEPTRVLAYYGRVIPYRKWLTSLGVELLMGGWGGDEIFDWPPQHLLTLKSSFSIFALVSEMYRWSVSRNWRMISLWRLIKKWEKEVSSPSVYEYPWLLEPVEEEGFYQLKLSRNYPVDVQFFMRRLYDVTSEISHPGWIPTVGQTFPYIDRDLIEFVIQLPTAMRMCPESPKALQKKAFSDIMPPRIAARVHKQHAGWQVAMGFANEIAREWKKSDSWIRGKNLVLGDLGLLDLKGYDQAIEMQLQGRESPQLEHVITVWSMEIWLRKFYGLW